jgi:hypothetical protein
MHAQKKNYMINVPKNIKEKKKKTRNIKQFKINTNTKFKKIEAKK